MNETLLLLIRIVSVALFDWILALVCGLLLAAHWLRLRAYMTEGSASLVRSCIPDLKTYAPLLVIALSLQFYLLVATMTDQPRLTEVLHSAPSVATTHAGKVTLCTLGVAMVLSVFASFLGPIELTGTRTKAVLAVLVGWVLAFHSAIGHAAMEGDFNLAELLQFLHLTGMALWAGGVLVSGFFVAKRLAVASARVDAAYLQALSRVSTYSVGLVVISGAYKGWIGLDRQPIGLIHTAWGRILLFKLLLVGVALGLGLLHRRWIRQPTREWDPKQTKMLLRTLRWEAICLSLVIVISAWLSSVDPMGG